MYRVYSYMKIVSIWQRFPYWEYLTECEENKFLVLECKIYSMLRCGRAVTHAVSRRLPAPAARFRVRVRSCGICCGQSGTRAGFLRELRFPLPLSHSTDFSTIITSIIQDWYSALINGLSNSGLGFVPPPSPPNA
jgi:hypothetical protein